MREIERSRGSVPESERLAQLIDADWERMLDEFPAMATMVGVPGRNHLWSDSSLAGFARRREQNAAVASAARSIDAGALDDDEDRLNLALFRRQAEENDEGGAFPEELLTLGPLAGPQMELSHSFSMMPSARQSDLEDVLSRLRGVPRLIDSTIERSREGLARGITNPRSVLDAVAVQIRAQLPADPHDSPLLPVLAGAPSRVRDEAAAIFAAEVAPAWQRLGAFFDEEYLPGARTTLGMSQMPDGEAWYAFRVRQYTTTSLAPKQIHDLGLSEVERIRSLMDEVISSTGFEGTYQAFCEFLRTDDRFFFATADELLAAYRDIAKRADPKLTSLFGYLPRTPYGVEAVPAHEERQQPTAYYSRGALAAGRPGRFFANTYDLRSRPKWEMEALTLHEAVPGHHLQISIAQEIASLPHFRKNSRITAFVEGWGLYAESLGPDMGFYSDPYSRFGQLTYEMWRALRLVIDTGIHSLGWSRERALEMFVEHAGKANHDMEVEVDRYITWPGQALAYKMGELRLKELKARAEAALGDRFDIRAFHDEVLRRGAVPLDVLTDLVEGWISEVNSG